MLAIVAAVVCLGVGVYLASQYIKKTQVAKEQRFLNQWKDYFGPLHVAVGLAARQKLEEYLGASEWELKVGRWLLDNDVPLANVEKRIARLAELRENSRLKGDELWGSYVTYAYYQSMRKWAEDVGRLDQFDQWIEQEAAKF